MLSVEQKQNLWRGFPPKAVPQTQSCDRLPAGASSGQRRGGFSLLLGCRARFGRTARAGCMSILPDPGWGQNRVSLRHAALYKTADVAEIFLSKGLG